MKKIGIPIVCCVVINFAFAQEQYEPETDGSRPKFRMQQASQKKNEETGQKKVVIILTLDKIAGKEDLIRITGQQKAEDTETPWPFQEKPGKRRSRGRCDE